MIPTDYNNDFFDQQLDQSLISAQNVLPEVLRYHKPASVIDIGCGVGSWLKKWKELGVKDIRGVDNYTPTDKLLIEKKNFIEYDLEKGYKENRKYDLVMCLEVAEHIHKENAEIFIKSLCELGDVVLFSAAIPGQEGTNHYNEQYPDYWLKIFKKFNFVALDILRFNLWNNEKVSWWYRQNIVFFINDKTIYKYHKLASVYHSFPKENLLALVHPEIFEYKCGKIKYYEYVLSSPVLTLSYFWGKIKDKCVNM